MSLVLQAMLARRSSSAALALDELAPAIESVWTVCNRLFARKERVMPLRAKRVGFCTQSFGHFPVAYYSAMEMDGPVYAKCFGCEPRDYYYEVREVESLPRPSFVGCLPDRFILTGPYDHFSDLAELVRASTVECADHVERDLVRELGL